MTQLDRLILATIEDQHRAAREAPRPPAWKDWEVVRWEDDAEYGPRYSPGWFGPEAASEAGRVRFLRAIRRLDAEGLVEILRGGGGRLERVRLTEAGLLSLDAAAIDAPPDRKGKRG